MQVKAKESIKRSLWLDLQYVVGRRLGISLNEAWRTVESCLSWVGKSTSVISGNQWNQIPGWAASWANVLALCSAGIYTIRLDLRIRSSGSLVAHDVPESIPRFFRQTNLGHCSTQPRNYVPLTLNSLFSFRSSRRSSLSLLYPSTPGKSFYIHLVAPGMTGSSILETVIATAANSTSCEDPQLSCKICNSVVGRGWLSEDGAEITALRSLLCRMRRPPQSWVFQLRRKGRLDRPTLDIGLFWTLSKAPVHGKAQTFANILTLEPFTLFFWCCPASAFWHGCYWLLKKKESRKCLLPFQLPQTTERVSLW